MNGSDHTRWSEDLAAYMLGALEPPEAAEYERHLEACEHCQGEMRWFEPALQSLPESVERQEPPPRLRQALIAEARADVAQEQGRERRSLLPDRLRARFGTRGLQLATGFAVLAFAIAAVTGYEIGKGGSGADNGGRTVLSTSEHGIDVKMVREGDGGTLHLAKLHQLVPDRKGQAETTIADMRGVDTVMVTEEPQGGSETPSGETIVTMSVPQ
jgi:anti-sigma factor RsiW